MKTCQNNVIQTRLWPVLLSLRLFITISNFIRVAFIGATPTGMVLSLATSVRLLFLWFKDLRREALLGFHGHKLEVCLRVAILLFILREIFFFFRFFWAFFDAAMAPTVEYGLNWPPKGILPISFYSVPLLNTIILLTSGVRVTWAHHSLTRNESTGTIAGLLITIFLGGYFLVLQIEEYATSSFSISDGIFGRIFFIATGFHGSHVLIGTIFLRVILTTCFLGNLTFNHHFSFEAATWYWHFVDVVWLFLYLVVYIWFS